MKQATRSRIILAERTEQKAIARTLIEICCARKARQDGGVRTRRHEADTVREFDGLGGVEEVLFQSLRALAAEKVAIGCIAFEV
jgi:hypothetical protein